MNVSNRIIGQKQIHFDVLDSTNEEAKRLLAENVIDGTVVTTSHQTAGRGQFGRAWESSEALNVMMSVIVHPKNFLVAHQFNLNMAISLAVQKVVDTYCENVTVKWPNDIYVGDKKIAGILIQNFIQGAAINSSIIGIGLNVNQESWPPNVTNPTSLKLESKRSFQLSEVIKELCISIDDVYRQLNSGKYSCLEEYNDRLFKKGKSVLFEKETGDIFHGIIKGVDDEGRLVIDQEGNLNVYTFGSISLKLKK